MIHKRAIDDIEKNERRQEILKAAASLFKNASYNEISMLEVSRLSDMAKGTVYLYFNTKEELFLALLDEAFEKWFADLQLRLETLTAGKPTLRIAAFASSLTISLHKQALLMRLLPILHTVLEHNVPYPAALEFKRHLRANLLSTGQKIEGCFAFLKAGQGAELLLNAYAGLIGLLSMTHPSKVAKQVLRLPEMALFVLDETAALRQMVSRLLTGIYLENERKK
jgi:AcrR family transcriptional regulator